MLVLLAAVAWAVPTFTPPPGILPTETAAALTECVRTPDLFAPLGAPARFVDLDLQDRTLTAYVGGGTDKSLALPLDKCEGLAALAVVPDGALRCTALPKGGFACKAIPGPIGRKELVDRGIAEVHPQLDACVAGKPGVWTIKTVVSIYGAPGDVDMKVSGPMDQAALQCLSAALPALGFGPLSAPVPVEIRVPAGP